MSSVNNDKDKDLDENYSPRHGKIVLEDIENTEIDEFPFSHRKSYRSPQEIMKYLKEKRIETKHKNYK